jgi:hypothetical protein
MATRRMINRDDFESITYGSLTVLQRHLFNGIMLHADDDGIIPVRLVKSRVLPYDDEVSIDDIFLNLKKLEEQNLIILYEKNEYLQVCDWWNRQQIRKQLYKRTIHPLPPNYKAREEDTPNTKCTSSVRQRGKRERRGESSLVENSKHHYPEHPLG